MAWYNNKLILPKNYFFLLHLDEYFYGQWAKNKGQRKEDGARLPDLLSETCGRVQKDSRPSVQTEAFRTLLKLH